jgi:phosphopentomutase
MEPHITRIVLLILDSVGIGALPDAGEYGDEGSNTLVNTARAVGGLYLPHLGRLGLGNIDQIPGVPPADQPAGAFGRMAEMSKGKDTTIGHWELAGIYSPVPLPTYPDGFPPEIMTPFEQRIERGTLGNRAASGTVIIEELGPAHMRTGQPIVYTSADSVFQIAAHEEIIPIDELYRICQIARDLLTGPHTVGRVIARPFAGEPGQFARTERRRDFSAPPPSLTVLDHLYQAGYPVVAIGKIEDIFAGHGISQATHTRDNMDGFDQTLSALGNTERGLIFTNLVDFDMHYGHRNNPRGYADALEAADRRMPELLAALRPDDLLIITADHGCDPTTPSTDHSREYVPLLAAGASVTAGANLGVRRTFSDVAATIADLFHVEGPAHGTSFAGDAGLNRDKRR